MTEAGGWILMMDPQKDHSPLCSENEQISGGTNRTLCVFQTNKKEVENGHFCGANLTSFSVLPKLPNRIKIFVLFSVIKKNRKFFALYHR